jgi:hypothetical protein
MFTMPCRRSMTTMPAPPTAWSSIDMIVTGRQTTERIEIGGKGNQAACEIRMRGGKRGRSR